MPPTWRGRIGEGGGVATMNDYELRMHDNVDLHMLLDRLHRNEVDLRERLAKRAGVLEGLDAISDPLYQRHYFAVESLKAERAAVEDELYRRESSVEPSVPRWFDRLAGWIPDRWRRPVSQGPAVEPGTGAGSAASRVT